MSIIIARCLGPTVAINARTSHLLHHYNGHYQLSACFSESSVLSLAEHVGMSALNQNATTIMVRTESPLVSTHNTQVFISYTVPAESMTGLMFIESSHATFPPLNSTMLGRCSFDLRTPCPKAPYDARLNRPPKAHGKPILRDPHVGRPMVRTA